MGLGMISVLESPVLRFAGPLFAGLAAAALIYWRRCAVQAAADRCRARILPRRASRTFLALAMVIYVVTFSALSVLQHVNFHSHNDLAIHAQVMWNTSQGRWFETTLLEDRPTNYLGHHFSPALLLLLPLYLLWPDATVLLVAQSVVLALGAVPVYLYARQVTDSECLASVMSAAYLLFPALHYVNLFDFHEVVLAVPLLSFAAYWLLTERYRLFFVFTLLSLTVKEEMVLVASAFALYIIVVQRRYRLGLLTLLLALVSAYLIMGIAMPALSGRTYFPTGRYGYLGTSFSEVLRSAVSKPVVLVQHLITAPKIEFLAHLLVPLGLLPLLGLDTLLLALPTMLCLLLSDYEPQYSIYYHYAAPFVPLLFLAGATGTARLVRWRGRSMVIAVSVLVLITSSTMYFLHSPGPLARHFDENGQYDLWPHLASGYSALAAIPAGASVMTMEEFAPHLAAREQIYIENEYYLPVEYIFQEHTARTATPRYPAFVPEGREVVYPYYEPVFDRDGYWVRRYQESVPISNELGVGFDDKLTLLAYQWRDQSGVRLPALRPGGYLDLIIAWRAEGQLPERYVFFVHLLDQDSHRWAQVDQEVERGVYPTTLWDPGMVVADHYRLSVPWGTPPGEYQVLIGAYSSETGQRLTPKCARCAVRDNALLLGPVRVAKPSSAAPAKAVAPQNRMEIRLNDEVELVGYDLGSTTIQQGETVPLILTWRAFSDVTREYAISVVIGQMQGPTREVVLQEPVGRTYPSTLWEASEVVRDWHDLMVPPDVPPGQYVLTLLVLDGRVVIDESALGYIEVSGRPHQFDIPEMQHRLKARFGEGILFLGYDLSSEEVKPGDTLNLVLYWQAQETMQVSYTVFTHLVDADERIWGQTDSIPLRGEAPTTSWTEGEVVTDEYEIVVDTDVPPGEYVIEVGMYDASTGRRLPVVVDGRQEDQDRILLATVNVAP
jgi:uncharacterized membrane protein